MSVYGTTRNRREGGYPAAIRGKRTSEDLAHDRHWLAGSRLAERLPQPRLRLPMVS
jgi:hypothetical protein